MRSLAWLILLAGCATANDARMLGTGGGPAAYELRGSSLATLDAQARQLCPRGHDVLRQWQSVHRPPDAGVERWLSAATSWTGFGEGDQAQMTVQCKA